MAEPIDLESTDDGVVLPVRAQPGARSSTVRGVHSGALRVSVTQVAEKGKANKALIGVLAKTLKLRKSQIELIAGATASQKRFMIYDVTTDELTKRIESVLSDSV
jgi:uncharacterized protein (TIGR00251 family)